MFVYHSVPIRKAVRCSYIITTLDGMLLDVGMYKHPYRKDVRCVYIIAPYNEGCQMFAYHNALQEGCQLFVYHSPSIRKVVRCSYIITSLQLRLIQVRISQRPFSKDDICSYIVTPYRKNVIGSYAITSIQGRQVEGCNMFAYHNDHRRKVVTCSYIKTSLQERCLMFAYHNTL